MWKPILIRIASSGPPGTPLLLLTRYPLLTSPRRLPPDISNLLAAASVDSLTDLP